MIGRTGFCLSLIGVASLLTACDEPAPTAVEASGEQRQVLRRGNGGDPETLDPALAEDIHAFNILADLYEGLIAEGADGSLLPGVAKSWDISDDGLTYTFNLRSDARWSNGAPVVANDFVSAFRRVAAPETPAAYGFLLNPLQNFSDVKAGRKPQDELGIVAIDEQTLTLELSAPASHLLSVLAMPIAYPMHGVGASSKRFSEPEGFVGNGAYILVDRQIDGPIRLRRNPEYWRRDSVRIHQIEYLPIVNAVSELNMYRAGELGITNTIPPGHISDLQRSSPNEVRISPTLALYYLAFDLTEAPLDNRSLRKALSMAIDRKQLVQLLGRGEQPAFGIVPTGVANHVAASYEWRDIDRAAREELARQSFRQAGYGLSEPLTIQLTYDVGDVHERIALAVSAMWRDVLGVTVELDKKEWKYFLDTRDQRSEWQVMRFSWFGDYNDPMTFAEIFRSDSPQNLVQYNAPDYDNLLDQAAVELDPDTRIELMTSAESKLIDDYPIAPLYFYVSKHMVNTNVAGFEDNVLDRHPSRFLSIKESD